MNKEQYAVWKKKQESMTGNDLFKSTVIAPLKMASEFQKKFGPQALTPEQFKRRLKNRKKRKNAR